jgi:hypothetical protein
MWSGRGKESSGRLRHLGVGKLMFESVDRTYQIGTSPNHRLGSGRISKVIWIIDASASLLGLNGAIEVANATIKISDYSFDLPNQLACGIDLKFSRPLSTGFQF